MDQTSTLKYDQLWKKEKKRELYIFSRYRLIPFNTNQGLFCNRSELQPMRRISFIQSRKRCFKRIPPVWNVMHWFVHHHWWIRPIRTLWARLKQLKWWTAGELRFWTNRMMLWSVEYGVINKVSPSSLVKLHSFALPIQVYGPFLVHRRIL